MQILSHKTRSSGVIYKLATLSFNPWALILTPEARIQPSTPISNSRGWLFENTNPCDKYRVECRIRKSASWIRNSPPRLTISLRVKIRARELRDRVVKFCLTPGSWGLLASAWLKSSYTAQIQRKNAVTEPRHQMYGPGKIWRPIHMLCQKLNEMTVHSTLQKTIWLVRND